jgi:hypothetical protein
MAAASPLPEAETGWYLYGVVANGAAPPGVSTLAEGEVAGLVRQVSLAEYDEAVLPERLADPAWLEAEIRAHEAVLEAALAEGPVLPCRFCTIYRDEPELRRFLAERGPVLAAALERLGGRIELGVKGFEAGDARKGDAQEAATGRAYLEARQREKQAREELAVRRGEIARELHERLLAAADDGVLLDLQRRELSGRDAVMVFNGSYLVADRARFEAAVAVAGAAAQGVDLELTGPWPPYNFVPEELART